MILLKRLAKDICGSDRENIKKYFPWNIFRDNFAAYMFSLLDYLAVYYIIAWGYSSMDKVLTIEEWGIESRPTVDTENEIIANKKKAKPNQEFFFLHII